MLTVISTALYRKDYKRIHIRPDWLLIYKIDGENLTTSRTGTHADLFNL